MTGHIQPRGPGVAALAFVAAFALQGAAQAASLTAIPSYADPLGGTTSVLGLNNNGWMTGSVVDSTGTHGFVRDASGAYTLFDVGSSGFTQGRSLNDANTVVGYTEPPASGDIHGRTEFSRAPGGSITQLVNPNTSAPLAGIAQGINGSGAIVGDYFTGPGNQIDGFLLDGSTFTDLALPGDNVRARGINDSGTIAGWVTGAGGTEGFILQGGTYSFFNAPGAVNGTFFEDINSSGLISGEYNDAVGDGHAFVFNSNTDTFTEIVVAGATTANAFGINDAGQVVVTTNIAGGPNNFLYDPNGGVPEPEQWALLVGGFGALGAALRRRRAPRAA